MENPGLNVEEGASALNEIAHDYYAHSRAARHLAEAYFDAKKVVCELLERVVR